MNKPTILESRPAVALVWEDTQVTYDALLERVWSWSRTYAAGDERVLLISENRVESAVAAYSVWAAGRTLVPFDFMSTPEEIAYVLDDCTPGLVLCSRGTRGAVEKALTLARHKPRLVLLEDMPPAPASGSVGPDDHAPIQVDEKALAAIVYTSGTTGSPKGVMLTFGNLVANVSAVAEAGFYSPETSTLLLLPLHHVLPLAGSLMAPLFAGGTIVFATSLAGEALVATLQKNAVTSIVGVPRFYDMLHRALREKIAANPVARLLFALASRLRSRTFSQLVFGSVHRKFGGRLRHLICGGAALSPETARTFDVLGFAMCEGFGMTECAPMITFPRPERIRLGSCGQALPGCEVRLVEGEIVARGPNVMRGYWGKPEETAAVLRDGWLHTGDLGQIDAQGFLFVTGRIKEIVVLPSGKKVNPILIEDALRTASPAVREAGVFLDGETLHALVVPNWDALPMAQRNEAEAWLRREVLDPVNEKVASYKRVQRVTLVGEELPRTRLGKLKRHRLPLIAEELAQRATRPATPADESSPLGRLASFLGQQYQRPVTATSRLDADLGVDSLGRVELSVFLERAFGVAIPETRLGEFETVGALAEFVEQYRTERAVTSGFSWSEILTPKATPALPTSSIWHRLLVHLSRLFVRLYFRARVRGVERLPAEAFILAPNHQSFLDGLFVTAYMRPRAVLKTLFYAKEKHVRTWFLKYLARRSNVVVMKSNEGILQSLQKLAAGLRRGHNVIIFPEGTRTAGGALGVFKESYAILSRELRVPVVPVVIDGAHRVLPAGSWWPRLLGRVSVTFLDPVWPHEGEEPSSFNERVRALIAEHLSLSRARAEA